jgi:hypothetical protein
MREGGATIGTGYYENGATIGSGDGDAKARQLLRYNATVVPCGADRKTKSWRL